MRVNTLFSPLGSLVLLGCAVALAILITPLNFLILQIGLLGIVFFIYLLLRDVTNVVIIWILSLLFVLFSKTSLGIDMPNLSLDRIIWAFLISYYLFNLITGQISLSHRTTEIFMLILCGLGIFSVIRTKGISFSRDILNTYSVLFNTYIVPFSIFSITKDFIREEQKIRKLFIFLSFTLLYISLTAIFEYFKITSFVFPRGIMDPGLGIHFGRARGPFLQAAINGTVLGMLSVANLHMAINTRFPRKVFFIIVAIFAPVAVFFTYTRAAWLAMVVSFTFILSISRRFRKYIGILLLLGAILMVPLHSKIINKKILTSRSYSISPIYDRINLYHTYVAMFMERPFLGFGLGNFSNYSHEYFSRLKSDDPYNIDIPTIHDTFAGTLVELGGLGLIVFLSILASIFWKSILLFKRLDNRGFLGRGFVVTFWGMGLVYLLNAMFIDMKNHQFQNVIFYLIAGIIAGLYQKKVNDAESYT